MTNQIHNLDCIDFMKTLPNESIDLTITDPPYTINYSSCWRIGYLFFG